MIVNFLKYVSYYNDYRSYVNNNPDCDNKNLILSWVFMTNTLMSILLSGILGVGLSLYGLYGTDLKFIDLFMIITPYLVVVMFIGIHLTTFLCEVLLYLIKKLKKNETYKIP